MRNHDFGSGAPPPVSVVMPVRNAAPFLEASVRSICDQDMTDFEFVAIDDGSTDGSSQLLDGFAAADPRIRILRRDAPGNLAAALNLGIAAARGTWIARLDADDIAVPQRLTVQLERLARDPSLDILGSAIEQIDASGRTLGIHRQPVGALAVALHAAVGTPFAHPATMIRRAFLVRHQLGYFDMPAQDYDLWARMLVLGARGDNVAEPLIRYRLHASSDSKQRQAAHEQAAEAIALQQLIALVGGTQRILRWRRPRFRHVAHALLSGNVVPVRPGDGAEVDRLFALMAAARPRLPASDAEWVRLEAGVLERAQAFGYRGDPVTRTVHKAMSALRPLAHWIKSGARPEPRSVATAAERAAFIRTVPVFINVRDRVACLRQLVVWLERAGHGNITLIDNASTYGPLLDYLAATPHRVVRSPENLGHTALWQIPELHPILMTQWFVYTDPDVVPDARAPLDGVARFRDLLVRHPRYLKAGFGLRIDDLPDGYHLKRRVVVWEGGLYGREIEPGAFEADLDTTFALYRPGTPYCFGPGLRTRGACQARHLPWYVDSKAVDAEEAYYRAHASQAVTTWNVGGESRITWYPGAGGIAGRESTGGRVVQALQRRWQMRRLT